MKLKQHLGSTAVALLFVAAPAFAAEGNATVASGLPGIETVGEVSAQELAQTGEARLPTGVPGLLYNNIKIWSNVGWQIGRLISPVDPGPYPGLLRATGLRR